MLDHESVEVKLFSALQNDQGWLVGATEPAMFNDRTASLMQKFLGRISLMSAHRSYGSGGSGLPFKLATGIGNV